jgi:gamma-glutamyl hercynylcysteine S-oxide synthase
MNARTATAAALALMLKDSRARTLTLIDAYRRALGDSLIVPQLSHINPPLWELGHIAWFADHWLFPHCERLPDYDALYDSSHVRHPTRWDLPLPTLAQTKAPNWLLKKRILTKRCTSIASHCFTKTCTQKQLFIPQNF